MKISKRGWLTHGYVINWLDFAVRLLDMYIKKSIEKKMDDKLLQLIDFSLEKTCALININALFFFAFIYCHNTMQKCLINVVIVDLLRRKIIETVFLNFRIQYEI